MKQILLCLFIFAAASNVVLLRAQGQRGTPAQGAAPAAPAPRLPDGRVNLGAPPDAHGIWAPSGIVLLYVFPFSVNRASAAGALPNAIRAEDVPFQPWARALHTTRELNIEFEYVCQDNNLSPKNMVGAETSVSRTSSFVP